MITKPEDGNFAPPTETVSPEVLERLEAIMKEVHPILGRALSRAVDDTHLIEDILQEVDVALFKHIASGQPFLRPPVVWASVVAMNRLRSELRRSRSKREVPVDEHDDRCEPVHGPPNQRDPTAAEFIYQELLDEVEAAIGNDRQFKIWQLSIIWGLSGVAIAESFGISQATVSRELTAAIAKAAQIDPHCSDY
jgi:RNA polymerase sigma factor (sigma-70 family)